MSYLLVMNFVSKRTEKSFWITAKSKREDEEEPLIQDLQTMRCSATTASNVLFLSIGYILYPPTI